MERTRGTPLQHIVQTLKFKYFLIQPQNTIHVGFIPLHRFFKRNTKQ